MRLWWTLALAAPVAVPAGSFQQGGGRASDEQPVREVALSAYRIDTTEVSVGEFESFVAAGGFTKPELWSPEGKAWLAEHPVVAVTWFEADAYCRWKGGSLPTEAQWERAACKPGAHYAWGDEEDFDAAWFSDGKFGQIEHVATRAVTAEPAKLQSPFGLQHTAGNVWEWTADAYHAEYYAEAPTTDPVNTAARPWRTLRGGSYMNLPSYCTCTHREPAGPDEVRLTTGFRCAYPPS
jgi:formylglycine-generating enzyme required for sulfatase activity